MKTCATALLVLLAFAAFAAEAASLPPPPAPAAQASTNKLARSSRSGQIHWGVNNAGRRVAYRYLPPVRTPVSPAESNEVATAFSCIAVFLDSAVLSHLLLYKNKFHDGGQTELENVADAFIREWHAQIESENGFTRQVMWFQVDLSYALCDEGILTPAAVTARVRGFAEDLVNLGYTPKWLSEFDDLSEAVK